MSEPDRSFKSGGGSKSWAVSAEGELQHERVLMWWVATLEHTLAWYEGMVLTYWGIKRLDGEWRLTVKATRRLGGTKPEHRIAFYYAEGMFECFAQLAYGVKRGDIRWLQDKYPPHMGA